jgi:putative Holliday junction resolvase
VVIHKESQTIFGVDWGRKNVGVAVGDLKLKIAHPLCVISSNNKGTLQDKLLVLLNEWTPVKVVYGLPYHENGSKHKLMPVIKKFASSIFKKYNSEYFFINELLSSNLASDLMHKSKNKRNDSLSAMIILDDFFKLEDNGFRGKN